MADENHSWRCPPSHDLLLDYLARFSSMIVIVLGPQKRILDFNPRAAKVLRLTDAACGRPLEEYGEVPGLDEALEQGRERGLRLHVRGHSAGLETIDVFVMHDGETVVLFGESLQLSAEEAVTEISRLNSQMADLMRELRAKNRDLSSANETITQLMKTDPLTGLANRRSFAEVIRGEMRHASLEDSPLSLVFADLDHFKQVNDTYGHDRGDEVLKAFSALLAEVVREDDLASRWGGEEFALIMRTRCEGAAAAAERVRQNLKSRTFFEDGLQVTASFGVSSFDGREDQKAWIRRTDRALYRAKEGGRDRVEIDAGNP